MASYFPDCQRGGVIFFRHYPAEHLINIQLDIWSSSRWISSHRTAEHLALISPHNLHPDCLVSCTRAWDLAQQTRPNRQASEGVRQASSRCQRGIIQVSDGRQPGVIQASDCLCFTCLLVSGCLVTVHAGLHSKGGDCFHRTYQDTELLWPLFVIVTFLPSV